MTFPALKFSFLFCILSDIQHFHCVFNFSSELMHPAILVGVLTGDLKWRMDNSLFHSRPETLAMGNRWNR